MAEWLHEAGIGEDRAILVEQGEIVEARIALPGALRCGAVVPARLARVLAPGARGIAILDDGTEIIVEPLAPGVSEGAPFTVEIVREPLPEPGRAKPARGRPSTDAPRPGATLAERIGAFTPHPASGPDRFEQAGWSELLDQAERGEIAFPGGALRMSLTPAMTLFDVDGSLPPAELAVAGAAAAATAIRRLDIGGSIGIDLPTLPGRAERQAAAAAVDALLPQPFERTAVNGFGFLQIVRRRSRPSLPEIVQADPAGAAARALLRRAERSPGHGPATLVAAPRVVERLRGRREWITALERRIGAPAVLQPDASLSISAGHVQRSPT